MDTSVEVWKKKRLGIYCPSPSKTVPISMTILVRCERFCAMTEEGCCVITCYYPHPVPPCVFFSFPSSSAHEQRGIAAAAIAPLPAELCVSPLCIKRNWSFLDPETKIKRDDSGSLCGVIGSGFLL